MKKILLVDDNVELLAMVEHLLLKNSFEVDAVSKWEEISSSVSRFKPDVIIMDISLSGADGRFICRQLKTSIETKAIPIILFSANHNMEGMDQYLPDAFIAKPFEKAELLTTISFVLEKVKASNS